MPGGINQPFTEKTQEMAMRRISKAARGAVAYLLLTIQAGVALADAPVFSGYGDLRFVVPGDDDARVVGDLALFPLR